MAGWPDIKNRSATRARAESCRPERLLVHKTRRFLGLGVNDLNSGLLVCKLEWPVRKRCSRSFVTTLRRCVQPQPVLLQVVYCLNELHWVAWFYHVRVGS